jgi:hypothetical protein
MGIRVFRDDAQLRRLDLTIARLEERPPSEQRKLASLIAALRRERASLLHQNARVRRMARRIAA